MIDRLDEMSTGGRIVTWIVAVAVLVGLLFASDAVFRALGQDPHTWYGWGLLGGAIAAPLVAAARIMIRYRTAESTDYAPAPDWVQLEWLDACRAAGVTTVPPVALHSGIGCMARGLPGWYEHEDLLVIHPRLVDHPRPLVRYTLAVEAARMCAHLSTATATGAYYAARFAIWASLVLAGVALTNELAPAPLLTAAVSGIAGVALGTFAESGESVYHSADAITHRHMGYRITEEIIDAAEAAEASGTWTYARFEPDLDARAEAVEQLPDPARQLELRLDYDDIPTDIRAPFSDNEGSNRGAR